VRRFICAALAGLVAVIALLPTVASAAPRLTLRAEKSKILSGATTVLSGRLTGAPGNSHVYIVARSFPYERRSLIGPPITDGRFKARISPSLNSKYRAVLKTANGRVRSSSVSVRVFLPDSAFDFRVSRRPNHRARAHYSVQFPRGYPLPLAGRRVSWYFREARDPVYRRIAFTRSTERSDRLEATLDFRLPAGDYNYFFATACFDFGRPFGRDLGVGYPEHRYCPRRFRDSTP